MRFYQIVAMTLLGAAGAAAAAPLTRAELVERFRATPATKADGLVQVWADCPSDMRREYQLPVAGYVANICNELYRSVRAKPRRFENPGLIIHIGDVRTNLSAVVTRIYTRPNGEMYTRLYVPSPGYVDMGRLRDETIRAFYRAVLAKELDEEATVAALHRCSPELLALDRYKSLAAWRERGEYQKGMTDEDYLKLMRKVLLPGVTRREDVLLFASRLYLYPSTHDAPFAGKYPDCTFDEAIALAHVDPRVRFAAFLKANKIAVEGGGHGPALTDAIASYEIFLRELAKLRLTDDDLRGLLREADAKLKGTLE